MQRYENYKPSDVAWLGDVPTHWDVQPLRAVTSLKSDKNRPELPVLSVYREYGVILKDSRDDNHNATSLDTSTYKVVKPGDLVVNKMKAWQGSMGVSAYDGIVSPAYITCATRADRVRPQYLHYLLRSSALIGVYNSLSYGVRVGQWDMHYEDFKQIPIPLPPQEEQERIVSFLDQKIAEIDAAIAKKERQASLLKEQQFKLINLAVTKGLDPCAAMISGGTEWIDSPPAHWQLMRIKHVLHAIVDTEHKTPPMFDEGPALMVRTSNVKNGELVLNNAKYTDEQTYRRWTRRAVPVPGDILFTREAPAGEACVLPEGIKAAIGQRMVLFKVNPERLDPHFAVHSIYSGAAKAFIELLSVGSTVAHFNMSDIGNIPLLLPPLQEQKAISLRIKSIQDQFQPLIKSVERGVERLQELKRTMIASVVLGQVKI
ncbi:restriction endonuclease subunit S [Aromatoleum evansii]|uniref:restriction endonuclease subunit S n=1 Tax=Aromatoleum evansii TaxID=59406 RepID=UPI00145D08BA|nr:restriction endonuclease subunit S [Aromatoleum evansii]NMG29525.1 restriction endonuclease subunit S [Aromatoleum evansii]